MATERVAYARKVGEPDYTEVILTTDEAKIPEATKWAEANGYVVRVAVYDLDEPPKFGANVLNK